MKKLYQICVASHLSNNSDFIEYDNYYLESDSWKNAEELAKKCIENWNKTSKKGVVYSIYNITPHN
jgi:hypothetical protein